MSVITARRRTPPRLAVVPDSLRPPSLDEVLTLARAISEAGDRVVLLDNARTPLLTGWQLSAPRTPEETEAYVREHYHGAAAGLGVLMGDMLSRRLASRSRSG
jgi:hypothetical protein